MGGEKKEVYMMSEEMKNELALVFAKATKGFLKSNEKQEELITKLESIDNSEELQELHEQLKTLINSAETQKLLDANREDFRELMQRLLSVFKNRIEEVNHKIASVKNINGNEKENIEKLHALNGRIKQMNETVVKNMETFDLSISRSISSLPKDISSNAKQEVKQGIKEGLEESLRTLDTNALLSGNKELKRSASIMRAVIYLLFPVLVASGAVLGFFIQNHLTQKPFIVYEKSPFEKYLQLEKKDGIILLTTKQKALDAYSKDKGEKQRTIIKIKEI